MTHGKAANAVFLRQLFPMDSKPTTSKLQGRLKVILNRLAQIDKGGERGHPPPGKFFRKLFFLVLH